MKLIQSKLLIVFLIPLILSGCHSAKSYEALATAMNLGLVIFAIGLILGVISKTEEGEKLGGASIFGLIVLYGIAYASDEISIRSIFFISNFS